MDTRNKINLILSARKILSVNSMYSARIVYNGGKQIATIYKSKEAKTTEDWIKEQVRSLNISKNYPWVSKDTLFEMNVEVVFKTSILLRDLDNCIKLIQDAIFRALDINDSHVVKIRASKKLWPGIEEEKILVSLVEIDKNDLRFDQIPKPNIVWCKSELKGLKKLVKRGVKSDILYYTDDPEKADTKVFIINPEEGITYNTTLDIAEHTINPVLNSDGFVYIAIFGNEEQWGKEKWASLQEFKTKMLERNKEYSGIKIKEIEGMEELYKWLNE